MKLPYVMLGIALVAGVFGSAYLHVARRVSTTRPTAWSLVFFSANLVLFWWLSVAGRTWLYPVLYVWAGVFGVVDSGGILGNLGVGVAILLLPLSLLSGTIALLADGSLIAAVMLKGSDGAFKHSIDRSCRELMYLPVPASVKVYAKSTIDTVMNRMGDGSAEALLDKVRADRERYGDATVLFSWDDDADAPTPAGGQR